MFCLEDLVERLTGTVPASDSVSPVEVATLATLQKLWWMKLNSKT